MIFYGWNKTINRVRGMVCCIMPVPIIDGCDIAGWHAWYGCYIEFCDEFMKDQIYNSPGVH